ncbi:Serine/threonine-protein kinase PknB [Enhygromyxa salina]|uniref:Serine/threonine-protein kinase PknB n=1 Tax=Enhygromyxa salina TaxID=215803 RepID=A0A2S9YHS1_9BACT|nr:tetratricopeptide repeat protein [Enhygromyxa salina]PRQ04629.1 Serine/threonine-protein kinase PknB [Enhygromyxa salina]
MNDERTTNAATLPRAGQSSLDTLKPGTTIDHFVVISTIGEGGMGVVFLARDTQLNRNVAIKMLHGDLDHASRSKILEEAQTLAQFNHPNIVSVYEVGTWKGRVWIAMEFIEGQTMSQWLQETERSWREVVDVFKQAIDGLIAAHVRGILHRDFKPSNVMIGRDRVRVLDFGLARARDADELASDTGNRQPGGNRGSTRPVGTPGYMAPELSLGFSGDERSDQYSVCVALWRALYGIMPLSADTYVDVGTATTTMAIAPPPSRVSVPRWLGKVVLRGLAKVPDHRHASLRELSAALDNDPRPRRWLLGAGVLFAFVAGALTIEKRAAHAEAAAACEAEAAAIDESWNEAIERSLSESILSSEVIYASETVETMVTNAREFSTHWRRATEATCRAESIDETWDADLATRARDCLAEQRLTFDSFVKIYTKLGAEPGTVRGAGQTFQRLPDVSLCQDEAKLLARPMTTEDEWDEILAIRTELGRAAALRAAGHYAEALEITEQVEPEANALGWLPLQAETLYLLGSLHAQMGNYEFAEKHLEAAYFAALSSNADDVAVISTHALAHAIGVSGARTKETLHWHNAGVALLDRAQTPADDIRRLQLHSVLGVIHGRNQDNQKAIEIFTEVLEATERRVGPTHPEVAESLLHLGRAYAQSGDLTRAIELKTRGLKIFEDAFGSAHPDVARYVTSLAGDYESAGDYPRALAMHEQALTVFEANLGPVHPAVASTLSSIGATLRKMGKYARAIEVTERALEIGTEVYGPDHPAVANTRYSLGIIHARAHEYDRAISLINQAIETWEAHLEADNPTVAAGHSALCIIHEDVGADELALKHCARALEIAESKHGPTHPEVGFPLLPLSEIQRKRGDLNEAQGSIDRALEIWAASPGTEHPQYGRGLLVRAEIELEREAWDASLATCEQAQSIFAVSGNDDPGNLAAALMCVGRAKGELGSPELARESLQRALDLLTNADDPLTLATCRFLLAQTLVELPGHEARARKLATQARDGYREHKDPREADVGRWLRGRSQQR